jgi:type IV secretory pathway VirJ component
MRYLKDAPDGVMEYLLIELMLWGSAEGYQHFNLGMAPLAGLENRQLAPIWNRIGALLFTHAEGFYNFQGLRAYKQKFDPVWEPRYLASPGGFRLPRILRTRVARPQGSHREVIALARAALLLAAAAPAALRAQAAADDVRDLPIIESVAARPTGTFAVFLSGDGGWAAIDKAVAAALRSHGISVAGINSMKYFWRTRTPDGASADLARVIRHFRTAWHADSVIVIGYSRGAGVAPFMVNRLPDELRSRVRLVALIGAEHTAGFKFHLTDLFTSGPGKGEPPVLPEIERLGAATPVICFYGEDETDTVCPHLAPPHEVVKLGGGHHFDGNYSAIGDRIHQALRARAGGAP